MEDKSQTSRQYITAEKSQSSNSIIGRPDRKFTNDPNIEWRNGQSPDYSRLRTWDYEMTQKLNPAHYPAKAPSKFMFGFLSK